MLMEPGEWVIFGEFKLKEWAIKQGYCDTPYLRHDPCMESISTDDNDSVIDFIDKIAAHKCPIVHGGDDNADALEA